MRVSSDADRFMVSVLSTSCQTTNDAYVIQHPTSAEGPPGLDAGLVRQHGGDAQLTTVYLTDEYGVPSQREGADGTQATASSQPFWFTGELTDFDAGTNFVYLRARYYAPDLGRFLTRDPWAGSSRAPGTLNRYAYVGNNPTNAADPSGLRTYFIGGLGGSDDQIFRDFVAALTAAGVRNVRGPVMAYDEAVPPGGTIKVFSVPYRALHPEYDSEAAALAGRIFYDLQLNPLEPGEQLNLIGYSGGGVIAFNTLRLLNSMGISADHLVTIAAPVYRADTDFPWKPANVHTWTAIWGRFDLVGVAGNPGYGASALFRTSDNHLTYFVENRAATINLIVGQGLR
jgi:RHS repeat-associated protein